MNKKRMSWLASLATAFAIMLGLAAGSNAVFPSGNKYPYASNPASEVAYKYPYAAGTNSVIPLPEGGGATINGIPAPSPIHGYN